MRNLTFFCWLRRGGLLGWLLSPLAVRAQEACLLVPVPLSQRVQGAALIVEARVVSQQVKADPGGNLFTRHTLTVYQVLKGTLPAGPLRLRTDGGTLGLRRTVATGTLALRVGSEGVFFLEPDPLAPPGEWRAYAGPQGLLRHDPATGAAHDPFAFYPRFGADALAPVAALAEAAWRPVQARPAPPAAPRRGAGPLATPVITDFSPRSVVAGSGADASLLTINGSGFGASQGTGFVEFRNADNPGSGTSPNYTRPLAADYVSWTDTQIQVRVPAESASGNPAGTGLVRVTNGDPATATSTGVLTVAYALSNVQSGNPTQNYRVRLVDDNGAGGYTLAYAASFPAAARAPYAAAVQSWQCATGLSRPFSPTVAPVDQASGSDGVNIVRFAASGELPAGVLGVTRSSYSGCGGGTSLNWLLTDVDESYAPNVSWNYGPGPPAGGQIDFQSVALHELGHAGQLGHIISANGVMNFAIGSGQSRRTLDPSSDVAGGQDVVSFSLNSTAAQRCNRGALVRAGCPLPVQLVSFTARYAPGRGTTLAWTTATELNAAYFEVESQAEDRGAGAAWLPLLRQPAAGTSPTPRQYQALDPRPLAGLRYYRLRQVDLDGTVAFSPTVAVRGAAPDALLAAYPNPATGRVQLSGPLAPGAAAQVLLLDALGRPVRRASGPAGQAALEVDVSGLAPGVYLLRWDGGLPGPAARLRLVVGGD